VKYYVAIKSNIGMEEPPRSVRFKKLMVTTPRNIPEGM
jgi:hypothetical protein